MQATDDTGPKKPVTNKRELVLLGIAILSILHSCDQQDKINDLNHKLSEITPIKTKEPLPPPQAVPKVKTQSELDSEIRSRPHHYVQEIDRYYYYEVPWSEADIKRNKGTHDVLVIGYFGRNKNEEHIIKWYDDHRKRALYTTTCIDPCKILNDGGKIITADDSTVLGKVAADVRNGALLAMK